MMVFKIGFLILVVVCFAEAAIPSYIHICRKSDPHLEQCIINSVNALRPKLVTGIPELNVPGIEPLKLDEIKLRSGPSSAKIDANITNILVWGPTGFQVSDLSVDLKKNRFIFKLKLPHIYFKGDYDIDMNVLILQYKGQGPITGNFTDIHADILLKGRVSKTNGVRHIQFRKFGIHIDIGHSYIRLENLFAGQRQIAKATEQVISDNTDIFINEIKPVLEDSLSEKFTEIANGICQKFSYDELFPN